MRRVGWVAALAAALVAGCTSSSLPPTVDHPAPIPPVAACPSQATAGGKAPITVDLDGHQLPLKIRVGQRVRVELNWSGGVPIPAFEVLGSSGVLCKIRESASSTRRVVVYQAVKTGRASIEDPCHVSPPATCGYQGAEVIVTAPQSLPQRGEVPADFHGQPARPCQEKKHGGISFHIEPDVPVPSCWKVHTFEKVRIVNATGDYNQSPETITGSLKGAGHFRLNPGEAVTLRLSKGRTFAVGDHCVKVSKYPGSCLAIWLFP